MITLSEIRTLKSEAALHAQEAWQTLRKVCLRESSVHERAQALATVEGCERERQILAGMEVELISAGRVTLETASDADQPESAPTTPETAASAETPPASARETPLHLLPPPQD